MTAKLSAAVAIALGVLGCMIHTDIDKCPTPISRVLFVRAILENGQLHVDDWKKKTPDLAFANGHFYSDKAPFPSLLALAGSVLWWKTFYSEVNDDKSVWTGLSWAGAVPIAALTAWGLFRTLKIPKCDRQTHQAAYLLTLFFIFFGGMPLVYLSSLWSHSLVISLLSIALLFAYNRHARQDAVFTDAERCIAGAALGISLASEYTAGLVVIAITILLGVSFLKSLPFWASFTIPCLTILWYNSATMGSLFVLPYMEQPFFPEMKQGLLGINYPDLDVMFRLVFGPSRGLLFTSPFLAIAWFGFRPLFERLPKFTLISFGTIVLQIVVISGKTWDWEAGPSFGPRYLSPIIPFFIIPCWYGLLKFPLIGLLLGSLSITSALMAWMTLPFAEGATYGAPIVDLYLPMMMNGEFNNCLFQFLGFSASASMKLITCLVLALFGLLAFYYFHSIKLESGGGKPIATPS
ncbi:MAG: hypothetical protein SFY81_13780 [Verrucomicrobiota bacterium]|nr:hypothetical protein [Verrucomicrobiota bacterium]